MAQEPAQSTIEVTPKSEEVSESTNLPEIEQTDIPQQPKNGKKK